MDDLLVALYDISKGVREDHNFKEIFKLWEVGGKVDTQCCMELGCLLKELNEEVSIAQN